MTINKNTTSENNVADTNAGQFRTGDYVVFRNDFFGNRVHKVKRVCKNGRIQIGRHYYDQEALRLLTDEELEHVHMLERADNVTKYLRDRWDYLSEEEIQQLENLKEKNRLPNSGNYRRKHQKVGIMNRISLHHLTKIATDIIDTEKQIKYLPDEQMSIVLENGDKRAIGEIDLHEDITDLKDLLNKLLEHIANTAAEIHTNAVNERDGYPENSTAKRALWLDEVQDVSSRLCSQIHDRSH